MGRKKNDESGVMMNKTAAAITLNVLGTEYIPPAKLLVPDGALVGRSRPVADEEVLALADSMNIRAGGTGQQQAVQVRKTGDDYTVVFGVTRKRAADLIVRGYTGNNGKKQDPQPDYTLRCEVVEIDDSEAFKRNVVENVFRNATSPIDNAVNQEELRTKHRMSDAAITRLYGYASQASVNRLKKLLTLPPQMQDYTHDGRLTLQGAIYLCEVLEKDGPTALQAIWDSINAPGENENDPEKLGSTHISATNVADAIKAYKVKLKEEAKNQTTGEQGTTPPAGEAPPVSTEGQTVPPVSNGQPTTEVAGKPLTFKQTKEMWEVIRDHSDTPEKGKELASTVLHVMMGVDPKRLGAWIISNLCTDEEWKKIQAKKQAKENAEKPAEETFGSYTEEDTPAAENATAPVATE